MFKKFVWFIIVTSLLIGLIGSCATPATEAVTIRSLTCPSGIGTFEADTILAEQVTKRYPELIMKPQETPGFVYNIIEFVATPDWWTNTTFYTSRPTLLTASRLGIEPFFTEPILEDWKFLYTMLFGAPGRFFATLDPNIKTLADAKGKRIGLGVRAQVDFALYPTLLLEHAYGITEENTSIEYLGPDKATEAMLDGRVDVAIQGAAGADIRGENVVPLMSLRTLDASGRKFYYIGVPREDEMKLTKALGAPLSYPVVFPPGSFPKQDEPLETSVCPLSNTCHPTFPEEVAYRIVMAVAEVAPELRELHFMWGAWEPELMVWGLTEENTHPGAIRAFKELGWWDKYEEARLGHKGWVTLE